MARATATSEYALTSCASRKPDAAGFEERTRQVFAIGEGQAVDHRMQRPVQASERCGQCRQILVFGDVAGQNRGHVKSFESSSIESFWRSPR